MILISHRGNINGRLESYENEPTYIDMAIKNGYDVEIDVWYKNKILFLGHDKPEYGVEFRWFIDRINKLSKAKRTKSALSTNECYIDNFYNKMLSKIDDLLK